MRPAVFFDRDGTLNAAGVRDGVPHPPMNLNELRVYPEAQGLVQCLVASGYVPVIVTNQPDVARGIQSKAAVDEMNARVSLATGIAAVYTCFHDSADKCACRKPKPGLLLTAALHLELDLSRSYMVGDRVKDVLAGKAAGCTTVFIDFGYAESGPIVTADISVSSFDEAVRQIFRREGIVSC